MPGDCGCGPGFRSVKANGTCSTCGGWLPGERPPSLVARWRAEPCGRCGHDVSDHPPLDEDEPIAHECVACGCDGFITRTAKTIARYEIAEATDA